MTEPEVYHLSKTQREILHMLSQNPQSSQYMAKYLVLSRHSIRRAISEIRQFGINIILDGKKYRIVV